MYGQMSYLENKPLTESIGLFLLDKWSKTTKTAKNGKNTPFLAHKSGLCSCLFVDQNGHHFWSQHQKMDKVWPWRKHFQTYPPLSFPQTRFGMDFSPSKSPKARKNRF
jgi:hypothetical protein